MVPLYSTIEAACEDHEGTSHSRPRRRIVLEDPEGERRVYVENAIPYDRHRARDKNVNIGKVCSRL